jgi:hypothetical protein
VRENVVAELRARKGAGEGRETTHLTEDETRVEVEELGEEVLQGEKDQRRRTRANEDGRRR